MNLPDFTVARTPKDKPNSCEKETSKGLTAEVGKEHSAYYHNLRGERNKMTSGQAIHPIDIEFGDESTDDEDYSQETQQDRRGHASRNQSGLPYQIHQSQRQFHIDDQEKIAIPHRSTFAPSSDPYQSFIPSPPPPSYPTETRKQGNPNHHGRSPGFSEHEDYVANRHYRRPRSFERLRPPLHTAPARPNRARKDFANPQSPEHDSFHAQSFWNSYNSDPNVSGYRPGEIQKENAELSVITDERPKRSNRMHSQPPSKPLLMASSSREPYDFRDLPGNLSHPRSYNIKPNTSTSYPRDYEFNSESSSSEDGDAWADSGSSDSQGSLPSDTPKYLVETSRSARLNLKSGADEDLLSPSDWNQRLAVTENAIQWHHHNRHNWPHTWRHSDTKTCPKTLRDAWGQILDADRRVSQVGLDATLPNIDTSKYQSKKKGDLTEIINAFTILSEKDIESTPATLLTSPSLVTSDDCWNDTYEQVQRLLKVRDYLIAVCRDAEFLNEFYPTMDAITWFEQAQHFDDKGLRTGRKEVVELMALKISHLSELIKSLNVILRAILWGWGDQSKICIHSDKETADKEELDATHGLTKELKLERSRSKIVSSKAYDSSEKRIQTCIHASDIGLASLVDEVEVFAAILSQALFYQCDVLISDDQLHGTHGDTVAYGQHDVTGLMFRPRGLGCIGGLIQYRNVWVLEQLPSTGNIRPYVSPPTVESRMRGHPVSLRPGSYVRTTISDLARIWGPIWKASELTEGDSWVWYRLPGGYIGSPRIGHPDFQVANEVDEAPCHFSTTVDGEFSECPSSHFFVPDLPYILIGHGLPKGLVARKSCPTSSETGLDGMALQSIGTLKPFKYKDSSSFNIGIGHGGAQVNWNTQFKTNPGILMKQSLLDRWNFEPKFRNSRLLLLWYGVEVSICTRNARRCRLVDLLRSRPMIQYLSKIYKPETGRWSYTKALFDALNNSNPYAFIDLYESHPEWRGELGTVVARCLDILKGSGVQRNGDLAAFVFMEKFHDPEKLAVLSKTDHTWAPLLKDSFESAAFAVMSHQCLEYPKSPGQACRAKFWTDQGSKSVLETSYTSLKRSDMIRLFKGRSMQINQRLLMQDSSRFNIKRRSTKGILLGTWRGGPLGYIRIPRPSEERFREKGQDAEKAIKVFVVSRKKSKLIRLREPGEMGPVDEGNDKSSIYGSLGDDEPITPSRRYQKVSTSKPLGTTVNQSSPPESRASTTDGPSKLRGKGTENVDAHSQTGSLHTRPQGLAAEQVSPLREGGEYCVDKATQTDKPASILPSLVTPSPTKKGDFLLPVPAHAQSNRRSSGSDTGSDSTHRSHRKSSGSQDERNDSSSRRRHRHSRSHGYSPAEEEYPREESLRSKLGLSSRR